MNLVIDVGNSSVKSAIFDGNTLKYSTSSSYEQAEIVLRNLLEDYKPKQAIVSNVGPDLNDVLTVLKKELTLLELNRHTNMPFDNNYGTPDTLGVDRLALAAAACSQYPKKDVLIIDTGTCITYDFVNRKGAYLGGAISPGIQMRYKALHEYTENLPLLNAPSQINLIGDSTKASIHSGIVYGVVNEIEGRIEAFRKENEDLTVVLTGGDTYFLANRVKNSIFANPNFLLEGLNTILIHNIE